MGQRLTVGFGVDRRIRTRRELLSKEQTIVSGDLEASIEDLEFQQLNMGGGMGDMGGGGPF